MRSYVGPAAKCTPDLRQGEKFCDFTEYGLQSPIMLRLPDPPAIIEFGHFSIFPHRRQLLSDGRPITLGGRAFDVLLALIEAPGRLSAQRSCKAEYGRAGSSTRRARGRDFSAWAGTQRQKLRVRTRC